MVGPFILEWSRKQFELFHCCSRQLSWESENSNEEIVGLAGSGLLEPGLAACAHNKGVLSITTSTQHTAANMRPQGYLVS